MRDVINVLVSPEQIPLIEVKNFLDWPEEMRDYLQNKLTIVNDPEYSDYYISGMRKEVRYNNPITCVAFINNQPIGWSLIANHYDGHDDVVMVYVDKQYRRKGIGRSLIKAIKNQINIYCFGVAWSKTSREFYNNINEVGVIDAIESYAD